MSLIPLRRSETSAARGRAGSSGSGPRALVGAGLAGTATPSSRPPAASRFRELILPHVDAAYSLARYLARDPVAAEDIAQEAMLKALRNLETLRGEPRPWLLAIVRNTFLDSRRRPDARHVSGPAADVAFAETADESHESPETALVRRGDVAQLQAAIEAIPEPFREALVLRDLEEMSYRDVSEITSVPLGTVMSRLSRARRMLAERMGAVEVKA